MGRVFPELVWSSTEVIAENFQLLDRIKRKKEGEAEFHFDEKENVAIVNK